LAERDTLIPPVAIRRTKAASQVFPVKAMEKEKRVLNAQIKASGAKKIIVNKKIITKTVVFKFIVFYFVRAS